MLPRGDLCIVPLLMLPPSNILARMLPRGYSTDVGVARCHLATSCYPVFDKVASLALCLRMLSY